jgi:hypothetical protein
MNYALFRGYEVQLSALQIGLCHLDAYRVTEAVTVVTAAAYELEVALIKLKEH